MVSKFIIIMFLHQIKYLNSKSNIKGMEKKLVRCGNQRELYALVRQIIFRIVLRVFGTTQKRRC